MGAIVLSSLSQVLQPAGSAKLLREQRLKLRALDRTQQDHGLWSQGTQAGETAERPEREEKRERDRNERDTAGQLEEQGTAKGNGGRAGKEMEKVKNVSVTGHAVELWDNIANCELSFGNIKQMDGKETTKSSKTAQSVCSHIITHILI